MTELVALSDDRPPRRLTPFLPARQHRRFVEFADAVRRHRYIGACCGAPGMGKTLSARTCAAADDRDRWVEDRLKRSAVLPPALLASRTAMLTRVSRPLHATWKRRSTWGCGVLGADIGRALRPDVSPELSRESPVGLELVIVDEADRLKTARLELVRDYFDRSDIGVVLIGMPGFARQLAPYPQLYSRIGLAHHYRSRPHHDHQQTRHHLLDTDIALHGAQQWLKSARHHILKRQDS